MRIEIEIPKEFEKHFNQDKFKDSLERIMADIEHSLENGDCLCAGRYEYETVEMLEKAFENSRQAYNIDKIIEELEKLADESYKAYCIAFNSDDRAEYDAYTNAIEIVKQEAEKFGRDTNVGSNGWIPCSEKLPEVRQDVLVTVKYTGFMGMHGYWIKTGHMEAENDWWGDCAGGEVIAWMELPSAYRPKEK